MTPKKTVRAPSPDVEPLDVKPLADAELAAISLTDASAYRCMWCGQINTGYGEPVGDGRSCSAECTGKALEAHHAIDCPFTFETSGDSESALKVADAVSVLRALAPSLLAPGLCDMPAGSLARVIELDAHSLSPDDCWRCGENAGHVLADCDVQRAVQDADHTNEQAVRIAELESAQNRLHARLQLAHSQVVDELGYHECSESYLDDDPSSATRSYRSKSDPGTCECVGCVLARIRDHVAGPWAVVLPGSDPLPSLPLLDILQ